MLNKLNEFLLTRGKAGLLRNIISKDSPTCGIYEKNGWVPVNSKEGWFIFNSPKDLAYASILKAIAHVKTIEEKGVFYLPQ